MRNKQINNEDFANNIKEAFENFKPLNDVVTSRVLDEIKKRIGWLLFIWLLTNIGTYILGKIIKFV